jgi:hypothetical protein
MATLKITKIGLYLIKVLFPYIMNYNKNINEMCNKAAKICNLTIALHYTVRGGTYTNDGKIFRHSTKKLSFILWPPPIQLNIISLVKNCFEL